MIIDTVDIVEVCRTTNGRDDSIIIVVVVAQRSGIVITPYFSSNWKGFSQLIFFKPVVEKHFDSVAVIVIIVVAIVIVIGILVSMLQLVLVGFP